MDNDSILSLMVLLVVLVCGVLYLVRLGLQEDARRKEMNERDWGW